MMILFISKKSMKISKTLILTFLASTCLGYLPNLSAQTFQIMTAGDSITAFNRYQAEMRTLFSAGGYSTTWLGTQGSAPNRHEGWPGKGLDHFNWPTAGGSTSMRDYMNSQFGVTPPAVGTVNVVTLKLGVNNMDHGLGLPGGGSSGFPDVTGDGWADGPKINDNPGHDAWITGHVNQLVDTILAHPSDCKLVIAKILPIGRGRNSLAPNFAACIDRINRLNSAYQAKFDSLSPALKARVRIVDPNAIANREYGNAPTFDFGTEAQQEGDWVHPRSDAGIWAEAAQIFYNAILSFSAPTYSLTGTVNLGGSGQSGVSISAGSSNTTTDASGNFTLNLPNGNYTITPSLAGFTYSPASRSVTVAGAALSGQNFTATALPTYSMSGTITLSGSPLAGVLVSDGTRSSTTNPSGFYSISNIPQGSYTITPTFAGHTFTPTNRTGTIAANLTNQNFTAALNPTTYEGFNYTPGAGVLANQSGGANWNSSWDATANNVTTPGFSYSSGGNLVTIGAKGAFADGASSFRSISASALANGTYWISLIARSTNPGNAWGGLSLFDGDNERLFIGQRFGSAVWGLERSGGSNAVSSASSGTASFLVVKAVLKAGSDDVFLWVNPSLASTPADGSAVQMLGTADFTFNRIRIAHVLGSGQFLEIDEIRIGNSFSDVAPITPPVPVIAASQSVAGTVGQSLSYSIVATNSPSSWTLVSGMPSGLNLNSATGEISGIPAASGTFSPSFTATNAGGTSIAQSVSINISPAPTALQTFRSQEGLASDGSQDMETPASDGVENLEKYAFNMIGSGPGQAASIAVPNAQLVTATGNAGMPLTKVTASGHLETTYIRRKANSNSEISYVVEYSNTLESGTWIPNASATESVESIDAIFERVVQTDVLSPSARFARVKIIRD